MGQSKKEIEEEVKQKMCEDNEEYQEMRSKNPFKMMKAMRKLTKAVTKNKFCKRCKSLMMNKLIVKKEKLVKGDLCEECEKVFLGCMK